MSEQTEKYFGDKIDLLFPIFKSNQSYVDLIMREQVLCILGQIAFDQREACAKALNECYHFEYSFYGAIYLDDAANKIRNAEIENVE